MELSGKVIAVLPQRSGQSKSSGNNWMSQDYVIETHEQYPRRMCFNVYGEDKIKQFNIQLGEEITVSFDINAREWQGRWFNDLRAWKIERTTAEQQAVPAVSEAAPVTPATDAVPSFEATDSTDDLPF